MGCLLNLLVLYVLGKSFLLLVFVRWTFGNREVVYAVNPSDDVLRNDKQRLLFDLVSIWS